MTTANGAANSATEYVKKNIPHKTYMDVLRLIAIFFVLYNHTGEKAAYYFTGECSRVSYWLSSIMLQIMTVNTTIFFFLSGALLLPKDEPIKSVMKKRVLKYAIIILVFDIIQYGYNYFKKPIIGFDIKNIIKDIYSTHVISQYWFLHAYLAFLLILPLLRALTKNMTGAMFRYLIIGYVLYNGLLPLVEYLCGMGRISIGIPVFENIIMYPLCGYYMEYHSDDFKRNKFTLPLCNLASLISLTINLFYAQQRYKAGEQYAAFLGFSFVIAMVLYLDIKYLCEKIELKRVASGKKTETVLTKVLMAVGRGTIVVYLFEPQLREGFYFIYLLLQDKISWFFATILWLLAAIAGGILVSCVYFFFKQLIYKNKKQRLSYQRESQ